jgi:hypothetical protein
VNASVPDAENGAIRSHVGFPAGWRRRAAAGPQTRVAANSDAIQAQINAINSASNNNMVKVWTAPNCTASYNGC